MGRLGDRGPAELGRSQKDAQGAKLPPLPQSATTTPNEIWKLKIRERRGWGGGGDSGAFGRKWVRGEEALLLCREFGCCVPQLRFKCAELRPSRRTGWGLLTGKDSTHVWEHSRWRKH